MVVVKFLIDIGNGLLYRFQTNHRHTIVSSTPRASIGAGRDLFARLITG